MITIGDSEFVQSVTLIIKDGEQATIEFQVPDVTEQGTTPLKLELVFKSGRGRPPEAEGSVVWSSHWQDQILIMDFIGWEAAPAPSAMDRPAVVGKFNGKSVAVFVSHFMCGPYVHNATIQLMIGGKYAN